MLGDRFNSCLLLARATCPHQAQMSRAHLIPQLLRAVELAFLQQTCMECKLFEQIERAVSLPALSTQVSLMRGPNRAHLRVSANFVATTFESGRGRAADGVIENISQGGAFIRVEDCHAFSAADQVIVTILLPAEFSGLDRPVVLQGVAIVSRVDSQKAGVALRFERDFEFFERINVS
jgi:PilZ domain